MITFEFNSAEVIRWVAAQLDGAAFGDAEGIGIYVDGVPAAGVVYHEYRCINRVPVDIRVSIVAVNKRWASRRSLSVLFGYPFNQLDVRRMTAIIAKSNRKSRSLAERLGFELEGTHPLAFDGKETALTYGITRNRAEKWIGQGHAETAAVA